jgi:acyl-CoA reductase-like NAD-dependent aldehyde dehydrogenase
MEKYRNFIGGEWVDSHSGETRENINPATGEALALFPKSNAADMKDAIDAAANAFDAWRLTPAPKRAEIIFKAGELLLERKEKYAREMTQEMGKVINEARGDVQEAIDMTYYIAGEGRRLLGYTTPSELPNKFTMCVRMPIGVVAAITPWNFPMAIPVWKIMPSLVAGNTVVIKPASYTPKSVYNIAEALEEAGLPKGALNVAFGPGGALGDAILNDKRVGLITFTGSTEVGTAIAEKAPKTYKRVSMEMGGKNAIIVLDDADIDLAIEGVIWSAFGTTGQRCTAASRIIVHKEILTQLTEKLVEKTNALKLGDGLNPDTDVGPTVSETQLQTVDRYVQIGKKEAKLLCGGERAEEGNLKKGFFYKPTIFGDVQPNATIAQEEIFGPVTAIIPVNSFEEAIEVNNGTDFGLSTSVYTRDVNRAFEAMRDIYTGLVYINAGTIGAEVHLPFGGTKGTGNGHREAGETALDECTEWKSIFVDYSGKLQKAQIIE